jgi:uncharacterized protein (TIGR00369 family)
MTVNVPAADSRDVGALGRKMGMEILELGIERAVGRIPVDGNTQPLGLLHGGASVVLGETLASLSAGLFAGDGRDAVSIEVNASHSHAATSGFVTAVCTPIRLGRTLTVHEVVVSDDGGRRCSTIRVTHLIRDSEH